MPNTGMDWWVIAGVIVTVIGVGVAYMRRPKKTSNSIVSGSGNLQKGGDGTTDNKIEGGDNNEQQG